MNYPSLLVNIKERMRRGQVRAALSANAELLAFYREYKGLQIESIEKELFVKYILPTN